MLEIASNFAKLQESNFTGKSKVMGSDSENFGEILKDFSKEGTVDNSLIKALDNMELSGVDLSEMKNILTSIQDLTEGKDLRNLSKEDMNSLQNMMMILLSMFNGATIKDTPTEPKNKFHLDNIQEIVSNMENSLKLGSSLEESNNKIATLIENLKSNPNELVSLLEKLSSKEEKFTPKFTQSLKSGEQGEFNALVSNDKEIPSSYEAGSKDISLLQNLNKESKEERVLDDILGKSQGLMKGMVFNKSLEGTAQTATEVPTVRVSNLETDMIKTIKYMDKNFLKELTVKVAPKELGPITIKLIMEQGVLKANITANHKDTYGLLMASGEEIKESLNNQNIKVTSVSINIYEEDTTYFSNSFSENNGRQSSSKEGETSQGSHVNRVSEDFADDESMEETAQGEIDILA